MKSLRALILGPPGGGKGTLSKRLVRDFDFFHVSAGDALRREVAEGTRLGRESEAFINDGFLVPDDVVTKLVVNQLARPEAGDRWLLDGFPRNIAQARELDRNGVDIDLVLNLEIPEAEILARLGPLPVPERAQGAARRGGADGLEPPGKGDELASRSVSGNAPETFNGNAPRPSSSRVGRSTARVWNVPATSRARPGTLAAEPAGSGPGGAAGVVAAGAELVDSASPDGGDGVGRIRFQLGEWLGSDRRRGGAAL